MGKHSRTKGRSFEQLIATQYRVRWPTATVRRSLQAHRPYEPDVVIEGDVPFWVAALWSECQHADIPQPLVKLAQAERDIKKAEAAGRGEPALCQPWLPIVVWRKSGASMVNVTTRLGVLLHLVGGDHGKPLGQVTRPDLVITLPFAEFLRAVRG